MLDASKRKTAKRHLVLLTIAVLALLAVLSISIPRHEAAPGLPEDEIHRNTRKVEACLECHSNSSTATVPMQHPLRPNCNFCHHRP